MLMVIIWTWLYGTGDQPANLLCDYLRDYLIAWIQTAKIWKPFQTSYSQSLTPLFIVLLLLIQQLLFSFWGLHFGLNKNITFLLKSSITHPTRAGPVWFWKLLLLLLLLLNIGHWKIMEIIQGSGCYNSSKMVELWFWREVRLSQPQSLQMLFCLSFHLPLLLWCSLSSK